MSNPYIEYFPNGNKKSEHYYLNRKFHNESGPAYIEYYDGGNIKIIQYFIYGYFHNENGPAVIHYHENGNVHYEHFYINDKYLFNVFSIEELKRYIKLQNIS